MAPADKRSSWKPTKKWFAALAAGAATILAHFAATGEFDGTEQGQVLLLAVSLAGAYLKRNDPVPTGVPGSV